MKTAIIFILFLIVGCNIRSDTSDPRQSQNISQSKKGGLFIKTYSIGEDTICSIIEEAWVENCWRYGDNGEIKKTETCLQLVLKLNSKKMNLSMDDYLRNWSLITLPDNRSFGYSDGLCGISLLSNDLPDNFKIKLINKGDTTKTYCTLSLKSQ